LRSDTPRSPWPTYAVIGYYLRHIEEIEQYLIRRERQSDDVQQRIERGQGDLSEIRNRLMARRATQG